MSTATAPVPSEGDCRRLRVTGSAAPAGVAAAVAEAVRRQGTVEVEAAGAEALQHAIEGIAAARAALAHDGREIAVAPSLVDDAPGREPAMRAAGVAGDALGGPAARAPARPAGGTGGRRRVQPRRRGGPVDGGCAGREGRARGQAGRLVTGVGLGRLAGQLLLKRRKGE
jgi:stage V sporulation protein SpoVS